MIKKGISPLIATVLIIAFTVVLAAVVMIWGGSFVSQLQEGTERQAQVNLLCSQVSLGVMKTCWDNNTIFLMVENEGNNKVKKLNVMAFGSKTNGEVFTQQEIGAADVKTYEIDYDYSELGDINSIKVVFYVQYNNVDYPCSRTLTTTVNDCEDSAMPDVNPSESLTLNEESCTPDCTGKQCGNDGCGGSCGTCTLPQTCNATGQCVCVAATCSSLGKQCGIWNDGCGNTLDCGTCAYGDCNALGKCEIFNTVVVKPAARNSTRWGGARCNDGTPFAFRIEKSQPASNTWVIFLGGEGLCDDNSFLCQERMINQPQFITTIAQNDGYMYNQTTGTGIFNRSSATNPEFYNANKVLASYCSSDVWTGSTSTLKPVNVTGYPNGWYFSGRLNVRAMLEALIEYFELDDNNPQLKVLFAGGSAGCIGADANAEQLVELLPNTYSGGRLKIISDAGFITNYNEPTHRFGVSNDTVRQAFIKAYDFWGSKHNSLCEQAQVQQSRHKGNCFMGSMLYPYITHCGGEGLCLPNLVQLSSIDSWFLGAHNINVADVVSREQFRNQSLSELNNPDIIWLFSGGDISYHTLLQSDSMWAYGQGTTYGQLVNSFWNNGPPQRVVFGNP